MFVSAPDERLLVRDTSADNHETTLVVPTLPVGRLHYYRCLVDEGPSFVEHAVVIVEGNLSESRMRALVETALSAARPTTVTFLNVADNPMEVGAIRADGQAASPAGLQAAIVCWTCLPAVSTRSAEMADSLDVPWAGYRVTRQGQFYSCEST